MNPSTDSPVDPSSSSQKIFLANTLSCILALIIAKLTLSHAAMSMYFLGGISCFCTVDHCSLVLTTQSRVCHAQTLTQTLSECNVIIRRYVKYGREMPGLC
ncbi:hypothetical protein BS17DRAFT_777358 [Gyrodon lividus]|nr:hypothetical protein BS17DRAFT_777358 [Gyrodon lividus]